MVMYINLGSENRVLSCGTTPIGENCVKVEVEDWLDFMSNLSSYAYIDGKLIRMATLMFESSRMAKVEELNQECQARIQAGFTSGEHFFQFNLNDQANFSQQLALLLLEDTDSITWKTENNGVVELTKEQFIKACKDGEVHKRSNIGHYWELKKYVLTHEFKSIEEIEAFNFDFKISTNTNTEVEVNAVNG